MQIDIDLIRERRIELGYSQGTLAIGITTQSTISKLESYDSIPSIDIFVAILDRLNLNIEEVIKSSESLYRRLVDMDMELSGHVGRVKNEIEKINVSKRFTPHEYRLFNLIKARISLHYGQLEEAEFYSSKVLELRKTPKDNTYYFARCIKAQIYMEKSHYAIAADQLKSVSKFINEWKPNSMINRPTQYVEMYKILINHALVTGDVQVAMERLREVFNFCHIAEYYRELPQLLVLKMKVLRLTKNKADMDKTRETLKEISTIYRQEKILKQVKDL
jgi:transcriptional regulator with XRE-family HTH domain